MLSMKNFRLLFKSLLIIAMVFCASYSLQAQVKIGNNPNSINSNSLLEMESTAKGVLLPRSATPQIAAMTAVPSGMILFNTTDSAIYLRRDTGWVVLAVSQRGVNPTLLPAPPVATPTFADFFALMPGDNPATVAPGNAVEFPQDGPQSGGIFRLGSSSFNLEKTGSYLVNFNVSISEFGQLVVSLNGMELPYTVVGRATGTSQLNGICIIMVTQANSVLEIKNPASAFIALSVTPSAGGSMPVSAHLVISKLQ